VLGLAVLWYANVIISVVTPPMIALGQEKHQGASALSNNTFYYPRLGITAPVTVSANTSPLNSADWNTIREALTKGVSAAFSGPNFADSNVIFLTGHSSDTYPHAYSAIFAGLGEAEVGDIVQINVDDHLYEFTVKDKQIIAPTNVQAFEDLSPKDQKIQRLVLVTCWPVLTTKNRLVIVTERTHR